MVQVPADVGQNVTLQCKGTVASLDSLYWVLNKPGSEEITVCYEGELNRRLADKYSLEIVKSVYNLTIRNFTNDDAGTYVCTRSKDEQITFVVSVISRPKSSTPGRNSSPTEEADIPGN